MPQDPAIFGGDLVANRERYAFTSRAAALLDRRLLLLNGLDDTDCPAEDHFFPLYRELRWLGHPRLEAHMLTTDHDFGGIEPASLMRRIADWAAAMDAAAEGELAAAR